MQKVKDMFFKGRNIRGEVGIEIEMEGENFPMEDLDSWYSKADGSLRGAEEDKREFVLIRPCKRADSLARLNSLSADLKEHGSKIVPSYRTGVHVHTNVRDMTFNQVFTYIFSYYMFEDALMEFAGKDRVGNLFCLRARDAEGVGHLLEKAIKTRSLLPLFSDNIRYSSMNLKALKQYGSVEFRGLPFNGDFNQIQSWIQLLLAVKDFSLTVENPKELVALLSKKGGATLAKEVFGDLFPLLPKVDWDVLLLNSVRLVQRLVYLIDWEDNEENIFVVATGLAAREEQEPVEMMRDDIMDGLAMMPQLAIPPPNQPALVKLPANLGELLRNQPKEPL